jgi:hypothetical protein
MSLKLFTSTRKCEARSPNRSVNAGGRVAAVAIACGEGDIGACGEGDDARGSAGDEAKLLGVWRGCSGALGESD